MSKAKKNILFAALAALALTVCLVGVTGAYFIAQASRTNTLTVGEVTFDPKEDIQNPDVPVQPGNSFMKRPYVVNTGNLPLRLRARVIFSDSAAQDACTLNYNTENWRYDETEDFWYYAKTLQPGEDCRNDALFDTVTYSESADATALNHYTLRSTLKRFRRAERGEKPMKAAGPLIFAAAIAAAVLISVSGIRCYAVLTGSMEPVLPVGSLLVVVPMSFDELKVGQDITYKTAGGTVTHRIVAIDQAARTVTTQGLTNNVADTPVTAENIVGRVQLCLPWMGYPVKILNDTKRSFA